MASYAEFDQVWLVKSAGMILGPFTMNELAEALRAHRISILDEVRNPKSRWSFIREFPELAALVKEIRDSQERRDKTDVAIDLELTAPAWEEKTAPDYDMSDIVPMPRPASGSAKERSNQKSNMRVPKSPPLFSTAPAEKQMLSKWFTFFAMGMAFAGAALSFFYYISQPRGVDSLTTAELLRLAKWDKENGLYEKSLEIYHRAKTQSALDIYQDLDFVPVLLLSATGAQEAQYILKSIPPSWNPDQIEIWQALINMRLSQYHEAEEILDRRIAKDPDNTGNHLNRMVNEYFLGKRDQVVAEHDILKGKNVDHPLVQLVSGLSILPVVMSSPDDLEIQKSGSAAVGELAQFAQNHESFRYEHLLLATELSIHVAPDETAALVEKLLDTNPIQGKDWIWDLQIDNQIPELSKWLEICADLAKAKALSSAQQAAVLAQCQLVSGHKQEAMKTLMQAPADELINKWRAFTSSVTTSHNPKTSDIKGLNLNGDSQLAAESMARMCLAQKDASCIEKILPKLSNTGVVYQEVLIRLKLLQNKKEQARQLLSQALLNHKDYRPFEELQEELR